jgi:hypothetical protein
MHKPLLSFINIFILAPGSQRGCNCLCRKTNSPSNINSTRSFHNLRVPLGLTLLSHRLGLSRGPDSPPLATPPPSYRRPSRHPPRPRSAHLCARRRPALFKICLRRSIPSPAIPLNLADGSLFFGAGRPPHLPTLTSIASSAASVAASHVGGGSAAHPR